MAGQEPDPDDIQPPIFKDQPGDIKTPFESVVEAVIEAGKTGDEEKLDQAIVAAEATIREQQKEHGIIFWQLGKINELQLNYKEAYEAYKQAVNSQPDNIDYLNNAGRLGNKTADYVQAQEFLNKSLELTISKHGDDHTDTAACYNNAALNLTAQAKHDEAELLYRKTLDIRQRVLGEDHPDTATSQGNLASNLHAQVEHGKLNF